MNLDDVKKVELLDIRNKMKKGVQFKDLSERERAIVAKLRHHANRDRDWLPVGKLALREGEELWDFISAMQQAIQVNRVMLGDGSLDIWLQGIFEDFVVVQDWNTGKLFKSEFTRDAASGEFTFTEPVEVRTAFVETTLVEEGDAGGDEVERAVAKRAPAVTQYVDQSERFAKGKWSNVLRGVGGR